MRRAPLQKPRGVSPSPFMVGGAAKGLWRGLAFIAPFTYKKAAGTGTLLNAHGKPLGDLTADATLRWGGSNYGLGVGSTGEGSVNVLYQFSFAPIATSDGAYGGDFSAVILTNPPAEAADGSMLVQMGDFDSGFPGVKLKCNSDGVSGVYGVAFPTAGDPANITVSGVIDGKHHLFGARRVGTVGTAWVDGVLRSTDTTASGGIAGGVNTFSLDTASSSTNIVFAAAWNRALSDMEMRALGRDPFVMFRPRDVERLWAAGEGVLSPTDLSDGFGFETPAVSQTHVLSAAEASLALGFETPAVSQTHVLSGSELALAFGFETPAVLQSHVSSAAEAALAFGFETPALFTEFVLSAAKAALAFGFESPAVLQSHVLSAAEAALAFGFETPALLQAHSLSCADALVAEYFDIAGLVQLHALGAQDMNFGLPFDLAVLVAAQATSGARTRSIGKNPRGENIAAHNRSTPIAVDSRSKSIRE